MCKMNQNLPVYLLCKEGNLDHTDKKLSPQIPIEIKAEENQIRFLFQYSFQSIGRMNMCSIQSRFGERSRKSYRLNRFKIFFSCTNPYYPIHRINKDFTITNLTRASGSNNFVYYHIHLIVLDHNFNFKLL